MPSPARILINTKTMPIFSSFFNENSRILSVGVNKSWDWFYKSLFKGKYETLDIKPDTEPDIVSDITNSGLGDELYDGVSFIGMYEFINNKILAINEIYRVLRKGGYLLACVPGESFSSKDWYRGSLVKLSEIPFIFDKFRILEIHVSYYKSNLPYYINLIMRKD